MSVVTSMEEAGPCRVKVTIEVPAPAVEAEIGRVVKDYRKHAQLPGFRKGKVPAKVIERRFKDQIKEEVAERLLPRYWQQAQAEKDLDPLLPPTLEEMKMEEGEPMTVVAMVETRPEIALGNIDSFDLPEEGISITDDEIDERLEDMRRQFGRWNVVEREAGQGDLVVGTVRSLDESDDEETEARPLHFEIGRTDDEELSLALTGKTAGTTFEHVSKRGQGEDAYEQRQEIEIREIKEQELPDLDDELAAQIGAFDSLDALREALTAQMRGQKEEDLRRRRYEALTQQLRERHPLAMPEGVVQQEAERMVNEQAGNLARQGFDVEGSGIDWGAMLESIRPQAVNRVHERLVLDAIAQAKELKLNEEKFETFLSQAAAQQGTSSLALRQRLDQDGRLEDVRAQMLREQTVALLLGDEDPSEENSSEEE